MKLDKQLVAASSVPLVLSVLAHGENYGYAIIQEVQRRSDGEIEWTDGMLYPVLHWLEEQDWIAGEWRVAETGRRRKYYRLTDGGRRALETHLNQWSLVQRTLDALRRPCHA